MIIVRYATFLAVLTALMSYPFFMAGAGVDRKSQLNPDANMLECQACHAGDTVLPETHPSIKDNSDCSVCHSISKEFKPKNHSSLRGKISLMHLHGFNEVGCNDCHEDLTEPKPLTAGDCLKCHESYQSVMERTNFLNHFNPHNSKHYGNKQACDVCHFIHEPSENLCSDCHDVFRPIP